MYIAETASSGYNRFADRRMEMNDFVWENVPDLAKHCFTFLVKMKAKE